METKIDLKTGFLLFCLGFLGVLSLIPVIPQLLAFQAEPLPISIPLIQIISVAQSSVLLLLMVWLGSVFAQKVGLKAPVIMAIISSESALSKLKPQIIPALIGGVIGGIFLLIFSAIFSKHLPADFLIAGEKLTLPWYARVLYGGITEEILIRWGLMSFLTWAVFRLTQKRNSTIRPSSYIVAIFLSSLLFGLLHLPVAFILSSEPTALLVTYVLVGNAFMGFIAGYLYWKQGLECSIGAHIMFHVVLIIGVTFT